MPYVPNPNDPTEPIGSRPAGTAAEEFRALKAVVAALVVAASASAGPRQVIQSAILDASGRNNALTVGAGLRPGLTASAADPYHLSHAAGFTGGKAINSDESLVANVADILAADLPTNNTSYIYRNYGVGYGSTLIPPQYDSAFDRTQAALLNFEGVNGAVATLDDFGNTWVFSGAAALSTAQFKFGTSSLATPGAGAFISSANFTSLGDGSWQLETWFRPTSIAGTQCVFNAGNAGRWGVALFSSVAGSARITLGVSSDGATDNVVALAAGATAIAINTWYKIRVVFDAFAGTYRSYLSNNGAAETQETNTASVLRVSAITGIRIGDSFAGASSFIGHIDGFRYLRAATKTATEVPAVVANTIADHKVTYFSIPKMQMFEATVASGAAGVNPILAAVVRLFLGEADTSGAAVTAIRNYAIRGQYLSDLFGIALATIYSNTHNLGTRRVNVDQILVNITSEYGWNPGDEVRGSFVQTSNNDSVGAMTRLSSRNTANTIVAAVKLNVINAVTAVTQNITVANWKLRILVTRDF